MQIDISTRIDPLWAPLEKLGARHSLIDPGEWYWMQEVVKGRIRIQCYKHCATRRYLNLDLDGCPWEYRNGEYQRDHLTLTDRIAYALS